MHSTQQFLNFEGAIPLARATDHESSHAAAERKESSGCAKQDRVRVLESLRKLGKAVTSKQLAAVMGVDRYMTARRLPDLAKMGLVKCEAYEGRELMWSAKE